MQTDRQVLHSLLPTDKEIVDGLRRHDERITRDYFYGYCRVAYRALLGRSGLRYSEELNFYSLAHEYYIALDTRHFAPLERRRESVSLRTWMIGGFGFVVRTRLKAIRQHVPTESLDDMLAQEGADFDQTDDSLKANIRREINDFCDKRLSGDPCSAALVRMMFIDGYKGKDVASLLSITPAAVSQRLHRLIENELTPYFLQTEQPAPFAHALTCDAVASPCEEPAQESPDSILEEQKSKREEKARAPKTRQSFLSELKSQFMFKPVINETDEAQSPRPKFPNYSLRITPPFINGLAPNGVFVFGSNQKGLHGGGAARTAFERFGAVWGQGEGMQGQSYGIPTMQGGVETIRPYVDRFIDYARRHPEQKFLVTPIGCGIAGFTPQEIAPLFAEAVWVENIELPESFWEVLKETEKPTRL